MKRGGLEMKIWRNDFTDLLWPRKKKLMTLREEKKNTMHSVNMFFHRHYLSAVTCAQSEGLINAAI